MMMLFIVGKQIPAAFTTNTVAISERELVPIWRLNGMG
jgi:hypothetical protein